MNKLSFTTEINAPAEYAFQWHERPGAFERLSPPWETLRVVRASGGIRDGGELVFQIRLAPGVWQTWHAEHFGYEFPVQFCDRQLKGPFASWEHVHRLEPAGSGACVLRDMVKYRLPLEPFSKVAEKLVLSGKIESMFAYRRTKTRIEIERHYRANLAPMRVAISGSTGLIGSDLTTFLTTGGHEVLPIVRTRSAQKQRNGIYWSPKNGLPRESLEALSTVDAVVHLAGEPILGVWTAEKKRRIRDSRVEGTRLLCEALAKLPRKPKVLICGSAVGFYGDRGSEDLTEESPAGTGFLAETCEEWEAATKPAVEAGIRVVNLRTGIVLTPQGGALAQMLPAFRFGVGGRLGKGDQYMSWISLDDQVALIHHALGNSMVSGPLNATAPHAVTNREFTRTLARVLSRPVGPPVPGILLGFAPGNMAEEALLASAKVQPAKALLSGFEFEFGGLEAALYHLLGRPNPYNKN